MGLRKTVASHDKPTTIIGFVRVTARVRYEVGEFMTIFSSFPFAVGWKHSKILRPKENSEKTKAVMFFSFPLEVYSKRRHSNKNSRKKHRSFVPAVEFIAYSLENWDEILGEMSIRRGDVGSPWPLEDCWVSSVVQLGKMCQTLCFKHFPGVFRYRLPGIGVWAQIFREETRVGWQPTTVDWFHKIMAPKHVFVSHLFQAATETIQDAVSKNGSSGCVPGLPWELVHHGQGGESSSIADRGVLRFHHLHMWIVYKDVSDNSGTPQIIHLNRVFYYKPSILGYHYFWKHPYPCSGV